MNLETFGNVETLTEVKYRKNQPFGTKPNAVDQEDSIMMDAE